MSQIAELRQQLEDLSGERDAALRQLAEARAREAKAAALQDEVQRVRLELITTLSEKEQALKQCRGTPAAPCIFVLHYSSIYCIALYPVFVAVSYCTACMCCVLASLTQ